MSYYSKDFILKTDAAKKLYHDYAVKMPIFDYHCHLSEKELLKNEPFTDLAQIWLGGDHYKWRLMRSFGIEEKYITGNAEPKEKFFAYCKALETAFGNPLYHWSQVELEEFFGCTLEINQKNAQAIWDTVNGYIKEHNLRPYDLIKMSNVTCVFTTNEAFDDLTTFPALAEKYPDLKVYPAFRADKMMNIDAPDYLNSLSKIEAIEGKISSLAELEAALERRLLAFIEVGCRASDIAPDKVYPVSTQEEADRVLKKAIAGESIDNADAGVFKGYMTYFLLKLCAKHGISAELHLGATRNNNTVMFRRLGADTGFDAMSQADSTDLMQKLFDRLNTEGHLPKVIVFDLNPKMNTSFVCLMGCFQNEEAKGKIQFGPAWWFNDHQVGIRKMIEDLAALGHLATNVGMLTDSRSFISYPRHQYFRRILCDYLGTMMENGEITADFELVGKMVQDVCYYNAVSYFNI